MIVLMNKLRTKMRPIMIFIAVAFILSSFLMYGAGSFGTGGSGNMLADRAVAEINGRRVMLSMMLEGLQARMEGMPARDITPMDFQAVLEGYAIELQLAQEIFDSGITVADEDVDQAMVDFIDNVFPTREMFHRHLQQTGARMEDYRLGMAHQMTRQRFVEDSIGTITVSDEETMEFYENMRNLLFRRPSGYMTSLARFTSEEEAGKLRAFLIEGLTWEEAVSHDDLDVSNAIFMTEEPQLFFDATFENLLSPMEQLETGEVSPVFEISEGEFAVGVKSERVEESFTPFEEVSGNIQFMLQQQRRQEALNNFTAGLLSRASIDILDAGIFPVPADESETGGPETEFEPEADEG
jgi:parvulin-like peptidyl-prolyl isomerase